MTNTYIVGQLVLLSDLITRTASGATVTDPTDVVTVYKPDGTTVTPSVVHPGVDDPNAYEAQITVDQPGWWEAVFNSTSTGAGAGRTRFYVSSVP
jgi:hypothetical protein